MVIHLPPDEDSPDLTDEEIAGSLISSTETQFYEQVVESGKEMGSGGVLRYELRRRKPDLYCRVRFAIDGEADRVLVIRMDWLKGT